jgi:hypothetical protein
MRLPHKPGMWTGCYSPTYYLVAPVKDCASALVARSRFASEANTICVVWGFRESQPIRGSAVQERLPEASEIKRCRSHLPEIEPAKSAGSPRMRRIFDSVSATSPHDYPQMVRLSRPRRTDLRSPLRQSVSAAILAHREGHWNYRHRLYGLAEVACLAISYFLGAEYQR